ncbi:MAG: hypothetical protein AAFP99_03625 [Pseudomonadota bacterium]
MELPEIVVPNAYAPTQTPSAGAATFQPTVTLEARLTEESDPLNGGLIWRIFDTQTGPDGKLPLIVTTQGGTAQVQLFPGDYFIHTTFGRASASSRLTVGTEPLIETVVLNAGGLRLGATLPDGSPVRDGKLVFDIYESEITAADGERRMILPGVPPRQIVRLPEGTYHIVSRYGDINAEIRADLHVQAGKTTDAAIEHRAALVTLNLVREANGFPLPDTAWSVLDSSTGGIIREDIGAYPSMILAAGEYTAVAKHRDRLFQEEFAVAPGRDMTVRLRTDENEVDPNASQDLN